MILELPNSFNGAHVSGVMTFGADDKLYIMAGDQGAFGKLQNIATGNEPDDRGVIFRLNVDGSAPPDNPFYEGPRGPMSRYYAYGIRNSFGIAVDPLSGHLWESENGPADYDEVNRVPAGMNGGHRRVRGPVERDAEGEQDLWVAPGSAYKDPQFSWLDAPALTALSFIGSRKLGCDYEYDLLVGSYGCRVVYRFDLDAARETLQFSTSELQDRVADNLTDWCTEEQSEILFAVGPQFNSDSTTDIENGPDGLVYVLSYSHGTLKRFQPVPGVLPDADADQVADACDCAPGDATVYKPPAEVPRLRLAGAQTTTLGWNAQNGATGAATTYTLVSGRLSDLRNDAGFAGACTLAAGGTTAAAADDRAVDSDDGFYYLVNAVNGCGDGTFGPGSAEPDPREALVGSTGDPCL